SRGVSLLEGSHFSRGLTSRGVSLLEGSHFSRNVSSFSLVSTTNTAKSLAGSVSLALALTAWRSPGVSEKLYPPLYVVTGPSLTWLRIAPSILRGRGAG